MKVSLYTSIYGRYDSVKPVPLDLGVPAFFYTDSVETAERARESGWTALVVPHSVATLNGRPGITEPMLNHKWWKTHPDRACPNTEVSIWIDGSMTITTPEFVKLCVEALGDDDWALTPHPSRTCIYPEADYSATLTWRYDAPSIKAQAAHYSTFHPFNWGLMATGFCVRRHTPAVIEVGEHWWDECVNWSHQDQISLPVLLRLFEGKVRINWNLPWFQWWFLHEHGS